MSFALIIQTVPEFEPVLTWPLILPPIPAKDLGEIPAAVDEPKPKPAQRPKLHVKRGKLESPHISMSIEYLRQLQRDNYVTDAGREFVAEEVDALLIQKEQRKADRTLKERISGIVDF